jgi:hypothetical protein
MCAQAHLNLWIHLTLLPALISHQLAPLAVQETKLLCNMTKTQTKPYRAPGKMCKGCSCVTLAGDVHSTKPHGMLIHDFASPSAPSAGRDSVSLATSHMPTSLP